MSNPFPGPKPPTAEDEAARIKQQTEYGFASQLLGMEAFQWLARECFNEMIAAEEKTALSIDATEEETKLARHKRHVLIIARDFAAKRQESTRSSLQAPK